jgi:ABC-type transport system involved in multi-copper enzyme maturation permease subunit
MTKQITYKLTFMLFFVLVMIIIVNDHDVMIMSVFCAVLSSIIYCYIKLVNVAY